MKHILSIVMLAALGCGFGVVANAQDTPKLPRELLGAEKLPQRIAPDGAERIENFL